jgi:hypothetical protein
MDTVTFHSALFVLAAMALAFVLATAISRWGSHLKALGVRMHTLEGERDSFKNIADESLKALGVAVNTVREQKGQPPVKNLAPVVPEHASPTTPEQHMQAELETMKAKLLVMQHALGLTAESDS